MLVKQVVELSSLPLPSNCSSWLNYWEKQYGAFARYRPPSSEMHRWLYPMPPSNTLKKRHWVSSTPSSLSLAY